MTTHSADNVVDRIWSLAVDRITKAGQGATSRAGLGDSIELAVAQAGTSALLDQVPAFDKLLYNSGYAAAARNTYLVLRRLGMPTDFFWKFEQWDGQRAFDTLDKVITRIFTALLSTGGAGTLQLVSADPVRNRFEVRFDDCAECAGLHAAGQMCFFHAGSFAGMLAAMLDRDFDAYESACAASEGADCTFVIGERSDREVAVALDRWTEGFTYRYDAGARFAAALSGQPSRKMGDLVDVGYYQMLLASAILTNIDVVEQAAMSAGRAVGAELAALVADRFGADPGPAIEAFYARLRYASVTVDADGENVRVGLSEAPDHLGPLATSSTVPFLVGEIEGLMSALSRRELRVRGVEADGDRLVLTLAPQV